MTTKTKISMNWEPPAPLGLGIPPAVSRGLMERLGQAARGIIDDETSELGVDDLGRKFKPYSPLYGRIRRAAGYPGKVDLTVSGAMLQAMTVTRSTPSSVAIGFLDASRPERKSLISQAWQRLGEDDRRAVWAMAMASKRKAGKGPGVGRRRSKTVRGRRSQGPQSGHPEPLPSEKMALTDKLRPWFGIPDHSKREQTIVGEAQDMYAEAYLENL